ncbi:hypothetical protein IJ847_02745 [Candidatus Saccharibacteria bacterium]|nr:hypothetical protein [Candidatus Saccharibacteria bacterium]
MNNYGEKLTLDNSDKIDYNMEHDEQTNDVRSAENFGNLGKTVIERQMFERRREEMNLDRLVEEARQRGKADFNYDEFAKFYRADTLIGEDLKQASDAAIERFRRDYYYRFPDVMNSKDYAIKLNELKRDAE